MEATFENEKFGKENLELFVFVVVFVVFETDKFDRSEFKYEAGKNIYDEDLLFICQKSTFSNFRSSIVLNFLYIFIWTLSKYTGYYIFLVLIFAKHYRVSKK
jgi:hypothetical protein